MESDSKSEMEKLKKDELRIYIKPLSKVIANLELKMDGNTKVQKKVQTFRKYLQICRTGNVTIEACKKLKLMLENHFKCASKLKQNCEASRDASVTSKVEGELDSSSSDHLNPQQPTKNSSQSQLKNILEKVTASCASDSLKDQNCEASSLVSVASKVEGEIDSSSKDYLNPQQPTKNSSQSQLKNIPENVTSSCAGDLLKDQNCEASSHASVTSKVEGELDSSSKDHLNPQQTTNNSSQSQFQNFPEKVTSSSAGNLPKDQNCDANSLASVTFKIEGDVDLSSKDYLNPQQPTKNSSQSQLENISDKLTSSCAGGLLKNQNDEACSHSSATLKVDGALALSSRDHLNLQPTENLYHSQLENILKKPTSSFAGVLLQDHNYEASCHTAAAWTAEELVSSSKDHSKPQQPTENPTQSPLKNVPEKSASSCVGNLPKNDPKVNSDTSAISKEVNNSPPICDENIPLKSNSSVVVDSVQTNVPKVHNDTSAISKEVNNSAPICDENIPLKSNSSVVVDSVHTNVPKVHNDSSAISKEVNNSAPICDENIPVKSNSSVVVDSVQTNNSKLDESSNSGQGISIPSSSDGMKQDLTANLLSHSQVDLIPTTPVSALVESFQNESEKELTNDFIDNDAPLIIDIDMGTASCHQDLKNASKIPQETSSSTSTNENSNTFKLSALKLSALKQAKVSSGKGAKMLGEKSSKKSKLKRQSSKDSTSKEKVHSVSKKKNSSKKAKLSLSEKSKSKKHSKKKNKEMKLSSKKAKVSQSEASESKKHSKKKNKKMDLSPEIVILSQSGVSDSKKHSKRKYKEMKLSSKIENLSQSKASESKKLSKKKHKSKHGNGKESASKVQCVSQLSQEKMESAICDTELSCIASGWFMPSKLYSQILAIEGEFKSQRCQLCDYPCQKPEMFLSHCLTIHMAHICRFCGKKYDDINSFIHHLRKHFTENKNYYCSQCKITSASKNDIIMHIRNLHRDSSCVKSTEPLVENYILYGFTCSKCCTVKLSISNLDKSCCKNPKKIIMSHLSRSPEEILFLEEKFRTLCETSADSEYKFKLGKLPLLYLNEVLLPPKPLSIKYQKVVHPCICTASNRGSIFIDIVPYVNDGISNTETFNCPQCEESGNKSKLQLFKHLYNHAGYQQVLCRICDFKQLFAFKFGGKDLIATYVTCPLNVFLEKYVCILIKELAEFKNMEIDFLKIFNKTINPITFPELPVKVHEAMQLDADISKHSHILPESVTLLPNILSANHNFNLNNSTINSTPILCRSINADGNASLLNGIDIKKENIEKSDALLSNQIARNLLQMHKEDKKLLPRIDNLTVLAQGEVNIISNPQKEVSINYCRPKNVAFSNVETENCQKMEKELIATFNDSQKKVPFKNSTLKKLKSQNVQNRNSAPLDGQQSLPKITEQQIKINSASSSRRKYFARKSTSGIHVKKLSNFQYQKMAQSATGSHAVLNKKIGSKVKSLEKILKEDYPNLKIYYKPFNVLLSVFQLKKFKVYFHSEPRVVLKRLKGKF